MTGLRTAIKKNRRAIKKVNKRVKDLDESKADLRGEITIFGEPPVEGIYVIENLGMEAGLTGACESDSEISETHSSWEMM